MPHLPSMRGEISPLAFVIAAPLLILSQHALVVFSYRLSGEPLMPDPGFWALPLRRLADLRGLSPAQAALAFGFSLAVAWALAVLAFRRANWSNRGHGLAPLAVVPALQVPALLLLALMPRTPAVPSLEPEKHRQGAHMIQGVLAGVAIIVFAVLVSAVTFGAYGWGLFVLTPLTVGMTTAYIANRDQPLEFGTTLGLVMWAAGLGCLALIMFALEGLICIVLIVPLGAVAALLGAFIGDALASAGHRRGRPLFAVALLPAAFVLEAAMPPSVDIATDESIDIAAPPATVWRVLTSDDPIATPPGLVGRAGLAYPLRGRILGRGAGGERLGYFSTGTARERITEWEPGRRLAFEVLRQPPAMEEIEPLSPRPRAASARLFRYGRDAFRAGAAARRWNAAQRAGVARAAHRSGPLLRADRPLGATRERAARAGRCEGEGGVSEVRRSVSFRSRRSGPPPFVTAT